MLFGIADEAVVMQMATQLERRKVNLKLVNGVGHSLQAAFRGITYVCGLCIHPYGSVGPSF